MTRQLSISAHSGQFIILLLSCFFMNGSNALGVYEFVDTNGSPVEKKCFPLKLTTEETVQTPLGEVCVEFKDETQEFLKVTYDTSTTDYVLTSLQLSYSPDARGYPRDESTNKPHPIDFAYQKAGDGQQVVVMNDVETDRGNFHSMRCPSTDSWTKYVVAHAMVRLFNRGDDTAVEAYGDGGPLYVENGIAFCSYFTMKMVCAPTPAPTRAPTRAPSQSPVANTNRANNLVVEIPPTAAPSSGPTSETTVADLPVTPAPSTAEPSNAPSSSPSVAPSSTPSAKPSLSSSSAPTSGPTTMVPSSSPSGTPAPSLMPGEDLVVGMSFVVITETSKAVHDLPHEMIQRSFEAFAHNVMAEMHVAPLGQRRRKLWVKYDPETFTVYDFLVNADCLNDPKAQAVAKSSALRPPPAASQCHRAYARFGVRIADEDPVEVCQTLRNGTLAAYWEGRLQHAHEREHPNNPIKLQPGDFEYCVPIKEFQVPDHGEAHWADSNPLANLTTTREVEDANEKPWWLIPLIVALSLFVLACLICVACKKRQRGNRKHKLREEKAALMS